MKFTFNCILTILLLTLKTNVIHWFIVGDRSREKHQVPIPGQMFTKEEILTGTFCKYKNIQGVSVIIN